MTDEQRKQMKEDVATIKESFRNVDWLKVIGCSVVVGFMLYGSVGIVLSSIIIHETLIAAGATTPVVLLNALGGLSLVLGVFQTIPWYTKKTCELIDRLPQKKLQTSGELVPA